MGDGASGDAHVGQFSNSQTDLGDVDENIWRSNVFFNTGSYGVGHGSAQAVYGITGMRFYHNTFVKVHPHKLSSKFRLT